MSNILIINAHHFYPFSQGKLNAALVDLAKDFFNQQGHNLRIIKPSDGFDVDEALKDHQWADLIVLQSPINWMSMPWSFKQYMDEVYTAGMGGALCNGDGRNEDEPKKNYGRGGTQTTTRYMLSLTANAPKEAFLDKNEFFEGKSVDDLMFPMHMNFKFFGMQAMPTFVAYDVMKNANAEQDFERYKAHLQQNFGG